MAGDVRGDDLDSWWLNRAAYRKDASQSAEQVRAAAAGFSRAAGDAVAAKPAAPADESLESLMDAGEAAMLSLQRASQQLALLDGERQQARADCASEQTSLQAASLQRIRAEREEAHHRDYRTKVQLEKSKTVVRKFGALFLFLIALYLIIFH